MARSKCDEAEQWMTPDQATRYQHLNEVWHNYSEVGLSGRGGKFGGRDFEFEGMFMGALHSLCCEVLGEPVYESRPIDPDLLR